MQTQLNPYLSFKDNTREAMEFYKTVFGGKLSMGTFKEYNASQNPSEDNKIMHSMLEADNGITFMASDTPDRMEYKVGTNYSMSLSGDNAAELKGYFEKLSQVALSQCHLRKPYGVIHLVCSLTSLACRGL